MKKGLYNDNTNDQEDDNTNAIDIKKSAAYIKWEQEIGRKTHVDLSGKNLTDEDALAIGELLKRNNTLKVLNLSNNDFDAPFIRTSRPLY